MRRHGLIAGFALFGLLAGVPLAGEAQEKSKIQPGFYLVLSSDVNTLPELTEIADTVRDRLERMSGVEKVTLIGERRYALRIRPDSARLAAYGILPRQLEKELSRLNLKLKPVRPGSEEREMKLESVRQLPSPEELGNIIVSKGPEGTFIRLQNVATIEIGMESEGVLVSYKGGRALALRLDRQKQVSPFMFTVSLISGLPSLQALLPEVIKLEIADPSSLSIESPGSPERLPS